jgi:cytochrome c-type biogenesis protein CcmH/NrfG
MFLTLLGWLLIVSSIAIWAPLIFPRREQLGVEIGSRLKLAKRNESTAGNLIVAAAVFLLVAGIGAATSYLREAPGSAGSEETDDEILARLSDYTRSVATEKPAAAAASELLPDVTTMISRLAARLESMPNDVQGWRMLGWSYFNTGRYDEAAAAYARAVALDPNSAELKTAYEAAKAKASEGGDAPSIASSGAEAAGGNDAAIRSMVDGLADRLERSPRDVEGWTRLMRSRVVLGEKEIATTAFRKALEVFKDDSAASGKITAAAFELGLKAE